MSTKAPDWDALIGGDQDDVDAHAWFPSGVDGSAQNLIAMEGLRARNIYVTSKALEYGGPNLFAILYRTARMVNGKVLHISDYREDG